RGNELLAQRGPAEHEAGLHAGADFSGGGRGLVTVCFGEHGAGLIVKLLPLVELGDRKGGDPLAAAYIHVSEFRIEAKFGVAFGTSLALERPVDDRGAEIGPAVRVHTEGRVELDGRTTRGARNRNSIE